MLKKIILLSFFLIFSFIILGEDSSQKFNNEDLKNLYQNFFQAGFKHGYRAGAENFRKEVLIKMKKMSPETKPSNYYQLSGKINNEKDQVIASGYDKGYKKGYEVGFNDEKNKYLEQKRQSDQAMEQSRRDMELMNENTRRQQAIMQFK